MATGTLGRGTNSKLPSLSKVRENKGLSKRELGLISDVHHTTIWRIEKGAAANRDTIRRLARALKVSQEELLSEAPQRPSTALEDEAEERENQYLARLSLGNEAYDDDYEDGIVESYLRIVRDEGATDESIRRVIRRALEVGKARGKELA